MVYVNVTTPAGATVERTEAVLDEVQRIASQMSRWNRCRRWPATAW
jgi:HAE1 family hydrophobic/amphiphilic exporter-1